MTIKKNAPTHNLDEHMVNDIEFALVGLNRAKHTFDIQLPVPTAEELISELSIHCKGNPNALMYLIDKNLNQIKSQIELGIAIKTVIHGVQNR